VQVIFNDGAGVFAPPVANSTARLESWPTSALEHFLVMLHHQLEMVRIFYGLYRCFHESSSDGLMHRHRRSLTAAAALRHCWHRLSCSCCADAWRTVCIAAAAGRVVSSFEGSTLSRRQLTCGQKRVLCTMA